MALNHLDENGKAIMVDISQKEPTSRTATASAVVALRAETMQLISQGEIKKGDVLAVARVAGILAAKQTPQLIPLAHPLPITSATVDFKALDDTHLKIIATVKTTYQTGVEMEALTAASVAALTIYDMCKAVDRGIEINNLHLESKSGGKSGVYNRENES